MEDARYKDKHVDKKGLHTSLKLKIWAFSWIKYLSTISYRSTAIHPCLVSNRMGYESFGGRIL